MVECTRTFSGRHQFAPRRYLTRGGDPNDKDAWYEVIACLCTALPPNEAAVREQLKATEDEKRRQHAAFVRLTAQNAPAGQERLL